VLEEGRAQTLMKALQAAQQTLEQQQSEGQVFLLFPSFQSKRGQERRAEELLPLK
jgi:hypothetical protein